MTFRGGNGDGWISMCINFFLSVNGDVISTNISRVPLTADDDCATREEKYDSLNKQIVRTAPVSDEAAHSAVDYLIVMWRMSNRVIIRVLDEPVAQAAMHSNFSHLNYDRHSQLLVIDVFNWNIDDVNKEKSVIDRMWVV